MTMTTFSVPTLQEASCLMNEAEVRNPGPWVQHSIFTAKAAESIASLCPSIDPSLAYILGFIHDIGRREGDFDMRHTLDGYYYLESLGFHDAARICLTHAFPYKNVNAISGEWDCSQTELDFVNVFLSNTEYSVYDKLIQLCDALALPTGFCLIEKRLVDVALRRGINFFTIEKWKAFLRLQQEFDDLIGRSIYEILPDVVSNTFHFNIPFSKPD